MNRVITNSIRILTAEDIARCLSMREAIAVVKEAFRQLSTGEANVPSRTHLRLPRGDTFVMPASFRRDVGTAIGVKVVSIREYNAIDGLPTVPAMVMLLDADTGLPRALLAGTYLTKLRTGAAVGAATDLLARQDGHVLAMIGAGALAPFCIEAVQAVRQIEEVRIFSRRHAEGCSNASEAVRGADVIVCATTSPTPVFDGRDLQPGAHVCGIGSYRPDLQEVDAITVQRSRVVVDSREACLAEAGDLLIPLRDGVITQDHIHAELGEIIAGLKPGRERDDEITFFKSVGNAIQDVAVANAVVARAEQIGVGNRVAV